MQIDYRSLNQLVQIRQKQIQDEALERDYFNTEFQALEEIKNQLATLLILERKPDEMFVEVPRTGEVKGEYTPDYTTYQPKN